MTVERRQWEGEVEVGGFGFRVGGEDLNLGELLEAGTAVRVTIEWPESELRRILAPSFGTLPSRGGEKTEQGGGG